MSEKNFDRLASRLKVNSPSVTATGIVGIPTLDTNGKLASSTTPSNQFNLTLDADGRIPVVVTGTPTILHGAAAGTGAAATISGNDGSGKLTVPVASGTTGTLATITFHTAYTAAPTSVSLTAADATTAPVVAKVYVASIGTTTFVVSIATSTLADATYSWYYQVEK